MNPGVMSLKGWLLKQTVSKRRGRPIVAPFHIHFANAAKLNPTIIESNARERATNGCWVPSYYQGAPVFTVPYATETPRIDLK